MLTSLQISEFQLPIETKKEDTKIKFINLLSEIKHTLENVECVLEEDYVYVLTDDQDLVIDARIDFDTEEFELSIYRNEEEIEVLQKDADYIQQYLIKEHAYNFSGSTESTYDMYNYNGVKRADFI